MVAVKLHMEDPMKFVTHFLQDCQNIKNSYVLLHMFVCYMIIMFSDSSSEENRQHLYVKNEFLSIALMNKYMMI